MQVKGILDEDFVNFRLPSMYIAFPKCDFKCDKECGQKVCQNSALVSSPNIDIPMKKIITRYKNNEISKAIVCAGLEPFDTFEVLKKFCYEVRRAYIKDPIVIYTGYEKEEIIDKVNELVLVASPNLIIKYGRFIPNQKGYDNLLLGVKLASSNQWAERYE